ncbi:PTS sugar transporter subunit IIA [Mycoplasma zalophidermidis]|uniref:PTS sugar transporter subunit IIA n=1 Tax=Mycoplasma zalophidermidis TaxID=398174 RepID=UPI001C0FC946|nr:PTS sugar transporter subunit IIA [Mycoplasma zalophidermidis]MBU4689731.1 PTS sugar transporter subunit IIA [Mycoplasma zalophidermidis]MCR8966637.1 PTS sugar transporter subunit IIA [Mycoplasma zalophidermidis]
MTKKDKFIITMLTIFTLGFCWLYWSQKNKKQALVLQGKENVKISFNQSNELVNLLGGDGNILNLEAKGSKLIIEVLNKENVMLAKILEKNIATGAFVNTNKVTLIMGEHATAYAKSMSI